MFKIIFLLQDFLLPVISMLVVRSIQLFKDDDETRLCQVFSIYIELFVIVVSHVLRYLV